MADFTERRSFSTRGRSRSRPGAAVAPDYFLHRAAEVDIDVIEAEVLAVARGIGHHLGIGAEELRGDGMLFGIEI